MAFQASTNPGIGAVLSKLTPTLILACFVTGLLNLLFGMDATSFGGIQNFPSFDRQFGTRIGPKGCYLLSPSRASFIQSVAYTGKFVGAFTGPIIIETIGHKWCIWITCALACMAILLECTSKLVTQFVWGRIILYFATCLAEIVSTTYQAEIVPAAARGAIVSTIQLFAQSGFVISAGVNQRFAKGSQPKDWIIPVSTQAIPPTVIFLGTFFIPNAPRWLISKSRKADAIRTLKELRPRADVTSGHCEAEANAIEEALESKIEKGSWLDLFRGTNRRRTIIASLMYFFQQITGQAFVSQYSPRFYISVGLATHAFDYYIASAVAGWTGAFICLFLIDRVGRRTVLLIGALGQGIFLFLIAGLGLKSARATTSETNGLVAGFVLYFFFYAGFWSPIPYVLGAEIGTAALREKTAAFGLAINTLTVWLVSFVVPYLLDRVRANVGWVFGSISFLGGIYVYFFVPETKNRSLEELDELFANHIPARKFAATETFGAGRRVAELENMSAGQADAVEQDRVMRVDTVHMGGKEQDMCSSA